jgi:hypothetical protein
MITARFSTKAVPLTPDFSLSHWAAAPRLSMEHLWNGQPAPAELRTTARLLWTPETLTIGYECFYAELDADATFDATVEKNHLWDRDVCEAFIRSPREPDPLVYKEFEVAPTGQWCDLHIDRRTMNHDWKWNSGMKTAAVVDVSKHSWRAVMAIPFQCFDGAPKRGDTWRGNLFRISKAGGERRFLSFAATLTPEPSFHVPERFDEFRFE